MTDQEQIDVTPEENQDPIRKVFNPNEHLIQIKSKEKSQDYLPVQWRLVWFRSLCPQGTIDTEEKEVDLDRKISLESFAWNAEKRASEKVTKMAVGYARFKAIVTDGKGGRSTGTKSENAANFPDYIEKAETGAIGRALAGLGYGTQFTADEFVEGERLADAPVEQNMPTDPIAIMKAKIQQSTGHAVTSTQSTAEPVAPTPAPVQTVSVPARLRETAPIQSSRAVSTAATLAPLAPVTTITTSVPKNAGVPLALVETKSQRPDPAITAPIDKPALMREIKAILDTLDDKGKGLLTRYWASLGIVGKSATWPLEQIPGALKAAQNWVSSVPVTDDQKKEYATFKTIMGSTYMATLAELLYGKRSNQAKADYHLSVLRGAAMTFELAVELDPEFAYLRENFNGAISPLDLFVDRVEEDGNFADYERYLRNQAKAKKVSEPFLMKYQERYTDWLTS